MKTNPFIPRTPDQVRHDGQPPETMVLSRCKSMKAGYCEGAGAVIQMEFSRQNCSVPTFPMLPDHRELIQLPMHEMAEEIATRLREAADRILLECTPQKGFKCYHTETHDEDWPDGGGIEICDHCGMCRFVYEQGASDWIRIDVQAERKRVQEAIAIISELPPPEVIRFDCNGSSAPAYSCNRPGDNSGEYVKISDIKMRKREDLEEWKM